MARTAIASVLVGGPFPADGTVFVWTAADTVNGNSFVYTGRDLVLIRNRSASSKTAVIRSSADPFNRTGDVTVSLMAGQFKVVGPLIAIGWKQADSSIWLDSASNEVDFAIVRFQ
jgi:hypothetical protein